MKNKNSLYKQLSKYGLNPNQWIIQHIEGDTFALVSHHDLTAYFKARTEILNGQLVWASIQVAI